jgi:prolyl-tRNA synthetase
MPLGLRVLRKVENIVREEMNNAGALELLMPAVQPPNCGKNPGAALATVRNCCASRTAISANSSLARRTRKSSPMSFAATSRATANCRSTLSDPEQVPRRNPPPLRRHAWPRIPDEGRLFLPQLFDDLKREYGNMYETYSRIFTRLGLKFRAVAADTGSIGGTGSHEFHVLADSGEDDIAFCRPLITPPTSNWPRRSPRPPRPAAAQSMEKMHTPGKTACADVAEFLSVPLDRQVHRGF